MHRGRGWITVAGVLALALHMNAGATAGDGARGVFLYDFENGMPEGWTLQSTKGDKAKYRSGHPPGI